MITNRTFVKKQMALSEKKRCIAELLQELEITDDDFTGEILVVLNMGGVRDIRYQNMQVK